MDKHKGLDRKMVLIDLDGTLLNNKKKIGDKDWQTLENLGSKGVTRVFATGRTLFSALQVLDNTTPFDFLVFSSGAGVMNWKNQKIIYKSAINQQKINETIQVLRKLEVNFAIQHPIPENHKYLYHTAKQTNTDFEWRNKLYSDYCAVLNSFYPYNEATQFLVILENEDEFETVKSKISGLKVIRATSPIDEKSIWLEIFPKHVSKASGGQYLCKTLNISDKNTIGIGNDYNDLDLLAWTNKSFAVANSPEYIKSKFTACADNENNPLTDVVKQLL